MPAKNTTEALIAMMTSAQYLSLQMNSLTSVRLARRKAWLTWGHTCQMCCEGNSAQEEAWLIRGQICLISEPGSSLIRCVFRWTGARSFLWPMYNTIIELYQARRLFFVGYSILEYQIQIFFQVSAQREERAKISKQIFSLLCYVRRVSPYFRQIIQSQQRKDYISFSPFLKIITVNASIAPLITPA